MRILLKSVFHSIGIHLEPTHHDINIYQYHDRKHLDFSDFDKLSWLNVPNRVDYLSLNLMYGIVNNTAPAYLCSSITHSSHNHNTRRSHLSLTVPQTKTQGSHSFKYCGIKLWNNLPIDIKNSQSKNIFKSKCKRFLMNKMKQDNSNEYTV